MKENRTGKNMESDEIYLPSIVLASASPSRAKLLSSAGLDFQIVPSRDVCEETIKKNMRGHGKDEAFIALELATAKAMDVARRVTQPSLVLGVDQTKSVNNFPIDKPTNLQEAKEQLDMISGKTHQLHCACVVYQGDTLAWKHEVTVNLRARHMTKAQKQNYMAQLDESVWRSSGIYQIEGPGIRLFECISGGDFFTVVGLPLIELINYLHTAARRLKIT